MISVEKPKLPKHLAYVLKTSLLERALSDAGINCDVLLRYWTPQSGGSILRASYLLPNERFDHVRAYISAGTVPPKERPAALDQLEKRALPALVAWLQQLQALPDNSPVFSEDLYFDADWDGEQITITATPRVA